MRHESVGGELPVERPDRRPRVNQVVCAARSRSASRLSYSTIITTRRNNFRYGKERITRNRIISRPLRAAGRRQVLRSVSCAVTLHHKIKIYIHVCRDYSLYGIPRTQVSGRIKRRNTYRSRSFRLVVRRHVSSNRGQQVVVGRVQICTRVYKYKNVQSVGATRHTFFVTFRRNRRSRFHDEQSNRVLLAPR